ncbi:helix-turn-helix domain-containing protein [Pseudomonas sp. BNK-43-a]|uniref:helix-turn-helix domain-containing protein n=2 Tax=Pseudomonas TaxID=286 RepID=UPI0039BF552A
MGQRRGMILQRFKMIFCRANWVISMIKCHLSRVMGEQKLKISDVSRDTGINRGTLTRMYYETLVRIDLDTINTLCEYLAVSLDELLEYQRCEKSA